MGTNQVRFWQLDAIRGLAVTGMVAYHFLFDLEYIFQIPIGVQQLPLLLLARTVAMIFILLVGFSSTINFEHLKSHGLRKVISAFVKKALAVFSYALIITLVTFFLFPEETIVFGILHFIALSLILLIPFLYLRPNKLVALVATIIFILGLLVPSVKTSQYWLIVLGFTSPSFSSLDYFPLFPWFGVALLGLVLGREYSHALQKLNASKKNPLFLYRIISKLGRYSLPVYLWHQPVLWTILLIIKNFS